MKVVLGALVNEFYTFMSIGIPHVTSVTATRHTSARMYIHVTILPESRTFDIKRGSDLILAIVVEITCTHPLKESTIF